MKLKLLLGGVIFAALISGCSVKQPTDWSDVNSSINKPGGSNFVETQR